MKVRRKNHLCLIVLAVDIITITTLIGVNGNPFPQTHSTSWITRGSGIQSTLNNLRNNHIIQTSQSCQQMGIFCSGHTRDSCARYCTSVGFTVSYCDGSCCLCSNSQISEYSIDESKSNPQNQFHHPQSSIGIELRNSNNPTDNLQNGQQIKLLPPPPKQISQGADLDVSETQQSSYILPWYLQFPHNYHNILSYPDSKSSKPNYNKHNDISKPTLLGQRQHQVQVQNHSSYSRSINQARVQSHPNLVQVQDKRNGNNNGHSVCQTDACYRAGKQLKNNMNPKVDPCDNFYEFACGGFIKNTQIPQDQTEVTPFSIVRDRVSQQLKTLFEEPLKSGEARPFQLAKTLYQSCMNTDRIMQHGIQPMKNVLDILGGWPVLEGNRWQPQYFTWSNFVVWFRELGYSHDYFMKISVEPDIQNVAKRLLTIGEPALGLSREVLIGGLADPSVNSYYKYMVRTAMYFGATRSYAESEMLKSLQFEIELAKSIYRPNNSRASSYYNPVTIAELEQKYTSVPWLELFQRLLPKKIAIGRDEVIMVSVPQYLDAFFNLVSRTDIRVISNYAVWRVVSSSMSYLNEGAQRIQFDFTATVTGQKERVSRSKECTDTVAASLGNAVGAMYIRRYFDQTSKNEALEMIQNIRQGFLEILDEINWMDEQTRAKAKEKALAIKIHVGYPAQHLSDDKISALYAEYNFKPEDYFDNVRNLAFSATNLAFKNLRTPINKNDWVIHGKNAAVNAFYLPLENAIQFPAGILQNPFFDSARPKYMNYGAIGWVTGHELSHGFDDQGHQFDKNGNLFNWWDPFTKKTYTTKTQCIINQYGNYMPTGAGIKINGVNSQGENIADNGGIKQAYRGYQSWSARNGVEKSLPGLEKFTPNQLFWISAANNWCSVHRAESLRNQIVSGVHSPGEFRVIGTFANNIDFSKDFSCPVGSQMNPFKKCSVW